MRSAVIAVRHRHGYKGVAFNVNLPFSPYAENATIRVPATASEEKMNVNEPWKGASHIAIDEIIALVESLYNHLVPVSVWVAL